MSLNETQLSILFVDRATRAQIQTQFELLTTSAQAFNKQMSTRQLAIPIAYLLQ